MALTALWETSRPPKVASTLCSWMVPGKFERTPALGRQVHYQLVVSSIAVLAANVPVAFIRRMLSERLWTQEHAIAYVERMTDQSERVMALAELVDDRPTLARDALASISATADSAACATGVAALAPRLPRELLGQALVAVDSLAQDDEKARTIAALAPHLDDKTIGDAFRRARAVSSPSAAVSGPDAPAARLEPPQRDVLLD